MPPEISMLCYNILFLCQRLRNEDIEIQYGCSFTPRYLAMKAVRSVQRAVAILFTVTQSKQPLGLSEIARSNEIDKATALRLLHTLGEAKLIEKDPATKHYVGGANLAHLSKFRCQDLRQISAPYLESLAQKLNETVCLNYAHHMERVCVDALPAQKHELRVMPHIGKSVPIYVGATGRVLMAYMRPDEIDNIIHQTKSAPIQDRGIKNVDFFRKRLDQIKQRGYEFSNGDDVTVGVSTLAVPIFGAPDKVCGAMTVRVPAIRMNDEKIENILPKTRNACRAISAALGCSELH